MDKIEALGAMIHQSQEETYGAGLLGVTVTVPRGAASGVAAMLTTARLEEIERRILEIEETLGNLADPNA